MSLCSRLLGSSSPRRAPQTVCESPRRAEVGCRGSHSFGKAVGQAVTTTRSAGKRPREQAKVIDPESDLAERRVAAAAAVQLSFSWAPRYGLAAHPGSAPVATLELWREQCIDDVAQYEKAYITHGIRVWTEWEQHCHQAGISPHAPQDSALVLLAWIRAREAATG